jgi:hypothetical protein
MILDGSTTLTVTVPASGLPFAFSTDVVDLNPGYGQGLGSARAPIFGDGARIQAQCEITTAFTIGLGAPVAAVYLVTAASADLLTNPTIIGSFAPIIQNIGGVFHTGAVAAALNQVGAGFTIVANPFSESHFPGVSPKTLRYLGLVIMVTNYDAGGPPSFSAGAIRARIALDVQNDASPQKFRDYPANMRVI